MTKRHYLIGISGGSGSGKTTFIKALKDRFDPQEVLIISLDEYYFPREIQKADERGVKNFDLPESLDSQALLNDLHTLLAGKSISRPEYVFNNPLATVREMVFHPAPIIIIEGLFILHYREISKMLDLKVFIHAKEDLKIIRRIKRDGQERNYSMDDVLYRYQHHVTPAFEKFIKPYVEECDLVITNNTHFQNGLEIFTAYLEKLSQKASLKIMHSKPTEV